MPKYKGKLTPKMVDKIRELSAAEVKGCRIVHVINRDYGIKISQSTVTDILTGYSRSNDGNFTEKDKEYIDKLIDGDVFNAPLNLTRLMKMGFTEVYYREGIIEAMRHFNETVREGYFTLDKSKEIVLEVDEWISSKDIRGEDEEWFRDLIKKRKDAKVQGDANKRMDV